MATLTANINATQTVIQVSGSAPETGSFFTLDSEAVRFLGTSRGADGRAFLRSYWSVERGVAGTTAATHSNGATLTQYYPDAAGQAAPTEFNGGTITDPLVIDLEAPNIAGLSVVDHNGRAILAIAGANGVTPPGIATLAADEHGVTISLDGLSDGLSVGLRGGAGLFVVDATGGLSTTPAADATKILDIRNIDNSNVINAGPSGDVYIAANGTRFDQPGRLVLYVHDAPADGTLSAGECALWFDQTDGAAKLMVKAKTADGTVRTGSVNLT
jgi:hypothetical protein